MLLFHFTATLLCIFSEAMSGNQFCLIYISSMRKMHVRRIDEVLIRDEDGKLFLATEDAIKSAKCGTFNTLRINEENATGDPHQPMITVIQFARK